MTGHGHPAAIPQIRAYGSRIFWKGALLCVFSGFRLASCIPKLRGSDVGFAIPPDTRPAACPRDFEGADLGAEESVSIIIPYLRESWNHFSKTMKSILHYTPDRLIKEFIFVSDGNPPELTYERDLTAMSPKVRMIINQKRTGLMKAKMKAVSMAAGSVLVFLEAHCIVNKNWLEPLLVRIQESPNALVQPALDAIPQDDFESYYPGANGHWRFEWNLNLIFSVPDRHTHKGESEKPFSTPATSGGIFAIRKDWWNALEFYDPDLREWGGDHVEATMKVWRCGGHIEIHPCSRVGHLFRDPEHRPYDVQIPTVVHNYARLATVWFDDHLEEFQKMKPETKYMQTGDIEKQKEFRNQRQCKSMDWYLKYVDPEMEWEAPRICIPHAGGPLGCPSQRIPPGRSTVDHVMPEEEYRQRRAEIKEYFESLSAEFSDFEL